METLTTLPDSLVKAAEDLGLVLTLAPKTDYPNGLSRDYTYGPWYVAYMQRGRTVVPNEETMLRELGLDNQLHPVLELLPEALCFAETVPQRKAVTQIRERALAEVNNPDRSIVAVVINDREPNRLATNTTYPKRVRMGSYFNRTRGKQNGSRLVGYLAWDKPTENTGKASVRRIDVSSFQAREVLTAHHFPQLQPASVAVLHHANCDTAIVVYDPEEPALHWERAVPNWHDRLEKLAGRLPEIAPLSIDDRLAAYQAAAIALYAAESALADAIITYQPASWSGEPKNQVSKSWGTYSYRTSSAVQLAGEAIYDVSRNVRGFTQTFKKAYYA